MIIKGKCKRPACGAEFTMPSHVPVVDCPACGGGNSAEYARLRYNQAQNTVEQDPGVALATGQPEPVVNSLPAAWDLVMTDMRSRDRFGKEKYGVRLQPNNGRDFLADAYQEALDLAVYLRGAIYERDGK